MHSTIDSSQHQQQYGDRNFNDRIILKCMSQKCDDSLRTGFIYLRTALVRVVMYIQTHKMGGDILTTCKTDRSSSAMSEPLNLLSRSVFIRD